MDAEGSIIRRSAGSAWASSRKPLEREDLHVAGTAAQPLNLAFPVAGQPVKTSEMRNYEIKRFSNIPEYSLAA